MDIDEFRKQVDRIGDVDDVDTIVPEPFTESDVLFYMPGVEQHRVNRSEVTHKAVVDEVTNIWVLLGGVKAEDNTEEEVRERMEKAVQDIRPPDGDEDSYSMKVTDTSSTIAGKVVDKVPVDGPFSHHFDSVDILIQDVKHWSDEEFIRFIRETNQAFINEFYGS